MKVLDYYDKIIVEYRGYKGALEGKQSPENVYKRYIMMRERADISYANFVKYIETAKENDCDTLEIWPNYGEEKNATRIILK